MENKDEHSIESLEDLIIAQIKRDGLDADDLVEISQMIADGYKD